MNTIPKRSAVGAALLLSTGIVGAQSFSRTETIAYSDNAGLWVIGQTARVTCVASIPYSNSCNGDGSDGYNDDMVETSYDAYAMPSTTSRFGKLQSTLVHDTTSALSSGQRGTLLVARDGLGQATTLGAWKRGIPQSIGHADGTGQSAQVNDNGWITSVTDENAYTTTYGHDPMGRVASIAYPTGDSVAWAATSRVFTPVAASEYGIPAGHWRETVITGNSVRQTYYDGMWRPLLVREYDASDISGTERFTRQAYDSSGRLNFTAYASSGSSASTGTWTFYDVLDRVTSVSQDSELGAPLTTTTQYLPGFQMRVTNPRGYATTTTYMTFDQPATDWPLVVAAPEGATTTIERDPHGKPTVLTRSGGGVDPLVRRYGYNSHQELCSSTEPETGATLYGYDLAGNLTSSAAGLAAGTPCGAANMRSVGRSYDARNRLKTLTFPDGNGNQTWNYTADGLPSSVVTMNAGNVVTNNYTYNRRRLLTGEAMVPDAVQTGWAMGYGYNATGHVTTEYYPATVIVTYDVNALGQATSVSASSDGGSPVVIANGGSYFPNGALKRFTYGNGIVHAMTQNARQLPSRSTDGTVLDLATSFDANGNVASVTDYTAGGRQAKSMAYDGLDRLVTASSPMFGTTTYSYDALDNLRQASVSGGSAPRSRYYCYNGSSRRLDFMRSGPNCTGFASPAVVAFGYDVQGNLLSKNGVGYTFDFGNRMRATAGLAYRYDAHGRRVRQDSAGTQLKYSLYSQDGKLRWQRDEPASKRISNLYLAGSLIAEYSRVVGSPVVTVHYLHTDALGSPIARTNSAGTVIETSEYEPYGRLSNRANDDRAGYTGHVMDSASGLTYMQQRYYDPTVGRFLSVDPVTAYSNPVGAFNRYWYADDNPYKFVDPDGRQRAPSMREIDCAETRHISPYGFYAGTQIRLPTNSGIVTSGFGDRIHPVTGEAKPHNGTDFKAHLGDPILSTQDGKVSSVTSGGAGGNQIMIQNNDGSLSGYAHTGAVVGVKKGSQVRSGQVIGKSDGSGRITGPHLHYTYRPGTSRRQATPSTRPVDPLKTQLKDVKRK